MKISKILIFSLILASFSMAFSQEDVLRPNRGGATTTTTSDYKIGFGIELGLNYNIYSTTMAWESEVPQSLFNLYKSGSGISPFFGVIVDFPIDNQFGFQARVAYDMRSFSNSYSAILDCRNLVSGVIDNAPVDADIDITGADLSISALIRYNVDNDFVITFGPMVSLPMGDYKQKVFQKSASDVCFFYDEFGMPHSETEDEYTISDVLTRFGLDLGLGYNIPIGDGMILTPQVRLNYFFTKAGEDEYFIDSSREHFYGQQDVSIKDKSLNSIKFSVALWF